ncbi:hypothetical protein [Halococcus sp. PRR34]|uniref:hypothetical protein n=1 Tax=Halococcus sp. PRR34 TaxID=3020830 RepID=UPI00235EF404|nr:hypothetical protein [Halococcus sp. PRR34]
MNARQHVHPQDAVTFLAALLAWFAMHAGEPMAAGIMIGAAVIGAVLSICRVVVIDP